MTIHQFNKLSASVQKQELFKCCGCTSWSEELVNNLPFQSVEELKKKSDQTWFSLTEKDWLDAFTHHPKIGDIQSLEKKFVSTKQWASGEQAGVNIAKQNILEELKKGNEDYEKKFGFIFIVCATGKSAEEMLDLLKQRLNNTPEEEIKIASGEQNKITHIRIDKLFA